MDFLLNEKTMEHIKFVLDYKLGESHNNEKMKTLYNKVISFKKEREFYQDYSIKHKTYNFDRNVIVQLKLLSIMVSSLHEQNSLPSEEMQQIYNELIALAEDIETKYMHLIKTKRLHLKSKDLLPIFLHPITITNKMTDKVFQFTKDHIEYLEFMAYSIINHLDGLEFDIQSCSKEFMLEFMAMDFDIQATDVQDPLN